LQPQAAPTNNNHKMKKLILSTLCVLCTSALVVSAQDAKPAKKAKHELTAEQKAVMDEMLAKYDTNKDGKLDKTEKAAMSKEDKDKLTKAGLGGGGKKKKSEDAAPTAPAAPATDKK
jgi:hypothetical protein